ncbi:MAG: SDR family NAD(P)-dependent oxidoreductase [Miltoncostaeaceae bacterium]
MELGIEAPVARATGGRRGMGRTSAEALAREGVAVAVAARGAEGMDGAVAAIRAMGGRAEGIAMDISDPAGPAAAVTARESVRGPVDALVANAGGPPSGLFLASDDADRDVAVQQNLRGTIRLIRAALPGMRDRGFGRIITVMSTSVRAMIDGGESRVVR